MFNIYIFHPDDWSVWCSGSPYKGNIVKFVHEWGDIEKADLTFNLGVFSMSTGQGCCYVRSKGFDIGYGGKSEILALNGSNACRGYSSGIENGIVTINAPFGGNALRNGVGMTTDGQYIVAQTTHAVTEKSFCNSVNNFVINRGLKVRRFVLEDGGGSTSMYSNMSNLTHYPSGMRRVSSVICFKRKSKMTFPRTLRYTWPLVKGEDVRLLQTCLGGIEADGIFGLGTRKRVIQAQRAFGIDADGIAGAITFGSLSRNTK